MKRLLFVLLALLLSSPAFAQFDLSQCEVKGSDPSVLSFPRTARFDSFGAVNGFIDIRTTGTANWPAVSIEPGAPPAQSGTLWVLERIGGKCYATGAERLRPNQLNGQKPEGSPGDLIGNGWLYDVNRWGPMANYNPAAGERIGLMVVAGSTRSDNQTPVRERTNVIEVVWPGAAGRNPLEIVWREGDGPAAPVPTSGGGSPAPVADDAFRLWAADFERWAREFADWSKLQTEAQNDRLQAIADQNERIYRDLAARIDASSQKAPVEPVKVDQGNVRGIVNLILGIAGAVGGGIAAVR